jgi:hypothetical protein
VAPAFRRRIFVRFATDPKNRRRYAGATKSKFGFSEQEEELKWLS